MYLNITLDYTDYSKFPVCLLIFTAYQDCNPLAVARCFPDVIMHPNIVTDFSTPPGKTGPSPSSRCGRLPFYSVSLNPNNAYNMLGMGTPSMNTSPTLPKWPPSTRYGLLPLPSTHPNHSRICPRTSIPSLNLNIPAAQAAASAAPTFSLLSQPLSPHPPTPQDAPSTSVTSPPPHPSMSSPTSSTLAPSNPSGSSQKNPVSLSPFSTVPQQPRCQHQNLVLHGQKLKIGWGKPSPVPGPSLPGYRPEQRKPERLPRLS